jgi:cytoskeletal protein CcmA (bactofilin family)
VSGTIPVLAAASTTQITSTPAELNILDGATVVVGEINALDIGSTAVGTAVASKAVILDSSKDYTGIRNLTISGEIDAATGDYSGAVDIAGATTTAAITASGIIKTDDTTAATSTTDGSLQTDGGLSVTLDAVIGDDLFMLSDAAVVTFGANKDVTLTHVHNTGLLLNAAMVMQFRDSAINIGSPADGDLDINADDEIELNSTLIDVNGNLDVSGTGVIAGAVTTAALTASGIIKTDDTTAATSTTDGSLQTDGGLSVTLDAVIGDDLFMLSDAAVVTFGANKDVTLTHVHNTGLLLNAAMVVQFRDSAINIGSPADGDLDINADDEIELNSTLIDINGNLDVSGTGVIAGAVTTAALTASGIIKTDDTTAATSTTDGSLQTDGGLSVAADAVIGDDLFMLSDAAVVTFGADKDVTLTHVADTGLLLNAAMVVQFRDSAINIGSPADGDLDINADDEIELNSTLIDVNGNLDVSGTIVGAGAITGGGLMTTGGNIVIPNAGNIGSAGDTDSIAIASNGVVTFSQAPVFPDGSIAVADLDIDGATDIGAAIVDADLFIVDDGAGGTNRKTTAARLKTYIDAASAPVQLLIKDVDDAVIAIRVGLASGGTDVEIQNSAGTALKSMTGAFTSADAALAA